jgi:hypothetical protein
MALFSYAWPVFRSTGTARSFLPLLLPLRFYRAWLVPDGSHLIGFKVPLYSLSSAKVILLLLLRSVTGRIRGNTGLVDDIAVWG